MGFWRWFLESKITQKSPRWQAMPTVLNRSFHDVPGCGVFRDPLDPHGSWISMIHPRLFPHTSRNSRRGPDTFDTVSLVLDVFVVFMWMFSLTFVLFLRGTEAKRCLPGTGNGDQVCKMGPNTSYKWSYGAPTSRVITYNPRETHWFSAIYSFF